MNHSDLIAALNYDPSTGVFTWAAPRKKVVVGSRAGTVRKSDGRRIICFNKEWHLDSRLAWFYMTGKWPEKTVDHRDRDVSNCKWENLRQATRAEQIVNQKVKSTNKLGVKGVSKRGNRYTAEICFEGKRKSLGSFATLEEASKAYRDEAKALYGEFSI